MNWNTEVKTSEFDANVHAENVMEARSNQRGAGSNATHYYRPDNNGNQIDLSGNANSIIGMNVNEVPNMVAAITEYCNNIIKYLDALTPEADSSGAVKGEAVQKALQAYFDSVKTYCGNLVSQLNAFSDKLLDAKAQWIAATEGMAASINSTSGSNFATGTKYNAPQA